METKNNLLYGRHHGWGLYLDIYYPSTPPPKNGYPLIICFHGGGWAMGNKKNDLFLNDLTKRGFAIASVQYLLTTQAQFPGQLKDIRAATRWLVDHAGELQVDPSKFGAAGASAGGQLALLLAFSQKDEFPKTASIPPDVIKAVCALYPPTNLVTILPKNQRGRIDNLMAFLLGGSVNNKMALAEQGSPMTYISPDDPPAFFVHARTDQMVPFEQSETMVAALRAAGVHTTFVIYDGKGNNHGFQPKPETISLIEKFFRRNLGVSQ